MAAYINLTTNRSTLPDLVVLDAAIKTATGDPTAVLAFDVNGAGWRGKKATTWTAPQIASAQNLLDTTEALTPQLAAQRFVDNMSVYDKAQNLAIIDALNVIRAALAPPKATITVPQAIAAIRTKAGEL